MGDVAFVTDVRYDYYEEDEVHWIKKEKQGLMIHLKDLKEMVQI